MADDNLDDAFGHVFGDRDFGKHGHRRQRSDANGTRPTAPPLAAALTAEALMTKTFDPIKSVVPGVVVEGLTLFAGKPKIGKSWLLLHAAIGRDRRIHARQYPLQGGRGAVLRTGGK